MENIKTDVQGQKNKNGSDYVMMAPMMAMGGLLAAKLAIGGIGGGLALKKLFHHKKPVHKQAPPVHVHQPATGAGYGKSSIEIVIAHPSQ